MKFNPTRRRRAEINVIPLIDILCMLLIFFIVTTTFKKKSTYVDLTLPKSKEGTEKTEAEVKNIPELTLKPSKATEYAKLYEADTFPLMLGDEALNLNPKSNSFGADLTKTLKEKGVTNVVLNFDETTPLSVFFKFYDAFKDAGVPVTVQVSKIGGATSNP
jgi:biopolymer transport protein ExbD